MKDPDNGNVSVSGTTQNSVANYTCDPGYDVVGDDMRICLETGVWSGSKPNCTSEYYDSQTMTSHHVISFGVEVWPFFPQDTRFLA